MRTPFFRIIAGAHRGAKLQIPPADITRPAKDNVKEAVFNMLATRRTADDHPLLQDALVLDVFAGSGSMGFEALSRGAKHVYMLEQHPQVLSVLKDNIRKLKAEASVKLLVADAVSPPKAPAAMHLIFIDPPYFKDLVLPTLAALDAAGWLNENTLIVAEVEKTEALEWPDAFKIQAERVYGRVKIFFLQKKQS